MSSDQQVAMEPGAHGEQAPAMSAKKLWRVLRAVHLVLVKGLGKHQPKLAALGVHLHHLLSKRHNHGLADVREHPALTYLSALSCRSMDPAAAVHPYPPARSAHGSSIGQRGASGATSLSSLSCRSMDPAAAVYQYQYRPREVEFSCSSTPLRRRRRAQRRGLLLQQHGAGGHDRPEYSSAAVVTRLFELMDVAEATDGDDDDGDMETATPWAVPAVGGPTPRQVRITDSPFPAREEDEDEGRGVVDRRADEFIMWFHDQLRMQQQRRPAPLPRGSAPRTGLGRQESRVQFMHA